MDNKWAEVGKASLQLPGRGMENRWLFFHVERSGSVEYRCETFRGALVDSSVDPTIGFLDYIHEQTNRIIADAIMSEGLASR